MTGWNDNPEDYGEVQEEIIEEEQDIPEVWWADDIRQIENPDIRQKEIEAAEKLLKEEKELLKRSEAGELDGPTFDDKYQELTKKESSAATRSGLESAGLSWDHLGDVAEDNRLLAKGNTELLDLKDRLEEKIREMGPDASQELADEMLEEGRVSKDTHETISRQVRLHRRSSE